jgi:hypothetical protein
MNVVTKCINRRIAAENWSSTDQLDGWRWERIGALLLLFRFGENSGTACMRSHFKYMVQLPNIFLTGLFSKTRLKRKDLQEILRLPWAQEVPGSNPSPDHSQSVRSFR